MTIQVIDTEKENKINRAKIGEAILSYMDNPNNKMLAIKGDPGTGKTATTIETFWENRMIPIYMAPMHRIITENITLSTVNLYDIEHLKGKTISCVRPEIRSIISSTAYFDVSPFCETCPQEYKEHCEHYQVMKALYRNPKPWASVHSYIPLFLPEYLHERGEYFDAIIIDENPIQYVLIQKAASDIQLIELKRVLDRYDDVPEKHFFNRLLDVILDGYLMRRVNYERIKELVESYDLNLSLFAKNWKTSIAMSLWNREITRPPADLIDILCKIIRGMGEADIKDMIFFVEDMANDKRYMQFNYYDKESLRSIQIPIIYLDASLNWEITSFLFQKPIIPLEITYKLNNIYQLNTGRYPLSSLKRKGRLQRTATHRIFPLIEAICNSKDNNVLLVCTKQIQNYIEEHLAKNNVHNYRFANFYGLKGQNSFMRSCDTVIICMRPSPPREQMKSFHNLSGVPIEIWEDMLIKDEIIQAIGRLRQNIQEVNGRKREKMDIFILTNTDLGYDNWYTYNQMFAYVSSGIILKEEESHELLAMELLRKIKAPGPKNKIMDILHGHSKYEKMMAFDFLRSKGLIKYNRSLRKWYK